MSTSPATASIAASTTASTVTLSAGRSDRTTRRLMIAVTFAAALVVGSLASDPADAAVRSTPEPVRPGEATAELQSSGPVTTFAIRSAAPAPSVLDDFSPAGHHAIDDFKAGPGCSVQCITSGIAYAAGSGAELVVTTDTPAKIYIHVWDDDGYFQQAVSETGQVEFHHLFDDLEPGHSYYAMAAAEDGAGHTSHGFGQFTTLG